MNSKTVVVTGGGSGGHIMPVLAVAAALKAADPNVNIVYVGQTGDRLADIPAQDPNIDAVYSVRAGKFRRYHGLGWRQWFDIETGLLNARDLIYIVIGLLQSWRLMGRVRPDIVFTRGGFVSVPVALGARLRGVPYITHDSDSTPSLANRLIARWARLHAVALPIDIYPYPQSKTVMVGVPANPIYQPMTPQLEKQYRQALNIPAQASVLLVTGGGNGALRLNQFVLDNAGTLLKHYPELMIVHIAGRSHETSVSAAYDELLTPEQRKRVVVKGFVTDMHYYSGVAEVVIARGGATNIAELAIQARACVIIPSPQLIWNVKNNQLLSDRGAVIQLTEDQAEQQGRLAKVVGELLGDPVKRQKLGAELANLARPDAANHVARILLDQIAAKQGT